MPSPYSPIDEPSFNESTYDAEALLGNKGGSYNNGQEPYQAGTGSRSEGYDPYSQTSRHDRPADTRNRYEVNSRDNVEMHDQQTPVHNSGNGYYSDYNPSMQNPGAHSAPQPGNYNPDYRTPSADPHGTPRPARRSSAGRLLKLFRDSRFVMFLGLVFIVVAGYSLIVSISYFANIGSDQSAMLGGDYSPEMIKNVGGPVGAWIAHTLLYNWFGIGSFLLIYYIGVCGLSMLKVYRPRFWDLTLRCLLTTVALSIILGFVTYEISSPVYWGGRHGFLLTERLTVLTGFWGVLALSIIMGGMVILLYLAELKRIIRSVKAGVNRHIERQNQRKAERNARREAELQRMAAEDARNRAEAEMQARVREEEMAHQRAQYESQVALSDSQNQPAVNQEPSQGTDPHAPAVAYSSGAPISFDSLPPTDDSASANQNRTEGQEDNTHPYHPAPLGNESGGNMTPAPAHTADADHSDNTEAVIPPTVDSNSGNVDHGAPAVEERSVETPLFSDNSEYEDEREAMRPLFTPDPLFNDTPQSDEQNFTPRSEDESDTTKAPVAEENPHNFRGEDSRIASHPEETADVPMTVVNTPATAGRGAQPITSGRDVVDKSVPTPEQVLASEPYNPRADLSHFKFPSFDLLRPAKITGVSVDVQEMEFNKHRITETLKNYGVTISHIEATIGPTVTLYEIIPADGVRTRSVKSLGDDLQLSLAALGVRIIAPIPAKGTIGIEVPNKDPQVVSMRSVLDSEEYRNCKMELPMALGKTISNEIFMADLAKMPHLLVAGATGMGKSVGLNAIITSLLYKKHPSELKFVLIDPKRVELSLYRKLERHYLASLPDEDAIITDMSKVVNVLNSLCIEMDNRLSLLEQAGARNIMEYNEKFKARRLNPEHHRFLPYIVLIIDEFADLIIRQGKEIENPVSRLAAVARAAGIHLIIATQRPTVNVITGGIKLNIPGRIAFRVIQGNDSRTILDQLGANQLIGRGDMLFSINGKLERVQCAFIDTPEVSDICEYIGNQAGFSSPYQLPEYSPEGEAGGVGGGTFGDRDELLDECARWIVQSGTASTSSLQRRYSIGYNRAGKIMDQLEAAGIVGPTQGGKPRAVLVDIVMLEQILSNK